MLACLGGCKGSSEPDGLERDEIEDDRPPVPYTVTFEGQLPEDLLSKLRAASQAFQNEGDPPRSRAGLRRRANGDVDTLTAVLRSEGYYDGRVVYRLEEPSDSDAGASDGDGVLGAIGGDTGTPPLEIVYEIDAGQQYRFDNLQIEVEGEAFGFRAPTPQSLGLEGGAPARADPVIDADQKLQLEARDDGRAFATSGDRQVIVDRDQKTMDVALRVSPGPKTPFGPITFEGAEDVDRAWLRRRLGIAPGEEYSTERLEAARQSLSDTGLFSTVRALPDDKLNEEDRLPVTFDMNERKRRTIGFGTGYQTDEGLFGRTFWEHRNIFGAGERLRLQAEASFISQQVTARFTKPDVPARNWNLLIEASGGFQQTDAFDSKSIQTGVGIELPFARGVTGAVGVAYRLAEVEERDEDDERFALLSLPTRLDWDFSNSLLDPSEGGRVFLKSTPFYDTSEMSTDGTWFWRNEVTHTRYATLIDDPRLVLAFRGRVGSIFGAKRQDVPADERFYAGGGGSVRGIAFQKAGPLDDDDDPIGGRSLLELSGEIRYRVTDSIGLVAFVDGGTVYDSVLPDFDNELQVGVGPGLRYVTPIGPLRLDIGFPVNPRSGVDDRFQLYVSIGQAF
ncbi:MAG: autotransporter assembly complex family protein [Pseudomonadota bacterium]